MISMHQNNQLPSNLHYVQPTLTDYDFDHDQTQYAINVKFPQQQQQQQQQQPQQPPQPVFKSNGSSNPTFFKTHSRNISNSSTGSSSFLYTSRHSHHSSTSSITSISSETETPGSTYLLTPTSSLLNAFPTARSIPTSVSNSSSTSEATVVLAEDSKATESSKSSPKKSSVRQSSNYYSNIANMVCLFWFNEHSVLETAFKAAKSGNIMEGCGGFSKLSLPTNTFKQFIMNVLKHTQLPPTAVSLALYYIIRLKRVAAKPIVGNANSEYRVFAVALMLANKFLDDNTYTNKTWAEVTHLPLKEISAMEVEFLANMRYSLHVKAKEWAMWQRRLRNWLSIHSSVCLSFGASNDSILSIGNNNNEEHNPKSNIKSGPHNQQHQPESPTKSQKRGLEDQHSTDGWSVSKKMALSSPAVSPSFQQQQQSQTQQPQPQQPQQHFQTQQHQQHIIAATRLSGSPYAPVYPCRTLLANAHFNSMTSSPVASSGLFSQYPIQQQQQQVQVQMPVPVYYYTLADLKHKVNPSPHCGILPAPGSQTQSPVYFDQLLQYQQQQFDFLENSSYGPGLNFSFINNKDSTSNGFFQVAQPQPQQQPPQSNTTMRYSSPLGSSPLHSTWNHFT